LPDGPFQTWWDNGQLQSQGRCEKGKLVAGTWKVFDRDGKPSTSQKTGVYPGQ
jgi:antitoxin component YwqK of YwqJK toxin-antitoxin module